jgi:hypothetical protein
MKRTSWLTCLILWLALASGPAVAEEAAPSGGEAAALAAGQIDAEAMAILQRMAGRLAAAEGFSVAVHAAYDVVQASGEKIEFGETRQITLSRPGALRVEVAQSDGDRRLVLFDGQAIRIFDLEENVYAQIDKEGSVDDAVRYLVGDLGVRLPLALLITTRLPSDLERRVTALAYVEQDRSTEVPADHLAGRTADVDFQVWVAREGEPLPRRIVITYKHAEGQPQFRATLSDWNLSPGVSPAQLAFTPPEGAERIPFFTRIARRGGADEAAPEQGGAEQ